MKTRILTIIPAIILLCVSFTLSAQKNLQVDGDAIGGPLVEFNASDISAANDILEIDLDPAVTSGQFIECQKSGDILFQVNHDGSTYIDKAVTIGSGTDIILDDNGLNNSSEIVMYDNNNNEAIVLRTKDAANSDGGDITLRNGTLTTIEIDANWGGSGDGRIVTDELQITGGSDISENFNINTFDGTETKAGMLVSIDPDNPGHLMISKEAYDRKIAGIISGANGVETGVIMGQKGSIADGEYPVALAGRVYVKADASYGSIAPGDLLTSSPTKGHVMKVKKHKKARGAIVGKAMTSIDSGTGFILVLVNLQ